MGNSEGIRLCCRLSAEYFSISATMSSVQHLREFISERLTAAAEEIFTEFEKTIVQYEEEMDRQRRLLDITWKPQINLHKIDLPLQHVHQEEEVLADQQLCDQERNSSLDRGGFPEIKEEQEEVCTSQEGEQLVLKQKTDYSLLVSTFQESHCSETEPKTDHLSSHDSPLPENQDQEGNKDMDSTRDVEMKPKRRSERIRSHRNDEDNAPISDTQFDSDMREKSIKYVCGKTFSSETEMEQHDRVHIDLRPYAHQTCKKSLSQGPTTLAHTGIQKGEKLPSSGRCRKSFSQSIPVLHMRAQTDGKRFTCGMCGKKFSKKAPLLVHMRIHTGEKMHSCKTCGKCFTQMSNLLRHMRVHTGERPFTCEQCGKKFRQDSHLLTHMRTHTGEKPYTCGTCGKSFSRRDYLRRHLKVHTIKK